MASRDELSSLVEAGGHAEELSSEDEKSSEGACGKPRCSPVWILLGCSGCCLAIALIVLGVLLWVGKQQVDRLQNLDTFHDAHITPPDFPRYMSCTSHDCPVGKKDDAAIELCAEPCYTLRFVLEWEAFAKSHPWKLVYFPSRPGPRGEPPVNISAWWLPADTSRLPPGKIPPRVVALHGLGSNNNHCGVQASCFHLRVMGFSCLTPTVRDYGLSGPSTHPGVLAWGYDYPEDILGAWDYAVNDPDGAMGGPLPPDQVGIMGFSKGALATAIAFNLEKRIPGAWIDSAPWLGLGGIIDSYIRPWVGRITPLFRNPVVWGANYFSGDVPVDYYEPVEMFGNCTAPRRRVMIAHGKADETVPIKEAAPAIFQIGAHIKCWDLWIYTPPQACNGQSHHQEMWEFPDETRDRFCYFWSHVFGQNRSLCGLDVLPKLDKVPYD